MNKTPVLPCSHQYGDNFGPTERPSRRRLFDHVRTRYYPGGNGDCQR